MRIHTKNRRKRPSFVLTSKRSFPLPGRRARVRSHTLKLRTPNVLGADDRFGVFGGLGGGRRRMMRSRKSAWRRSTGAGRANPVLVGAVSIVLLGTGAAVMYFVDPGRRHAQKTRSDDTATGSSATPVTPDVQRGFEDVAAADRNVEELEDVGSFLHPAGVVAPDKASVLVPEGSVHRSEFLSGNGEFRPTTK
jgi:hypothetical protein